MITANSPFRDFLLKLFEFGLEYFELYYGFYRAEVVDNEDPNNQGRVKLKVPMLNMPSDKSLPHWAYPVISGNPSGQGKGDYRVPEVGDFVWVAFEGGKVATPLYFSGGWFAKNEVPEDFEGIYDRGFKSTSGHLVRFRDKDGEESVTLRHSGGTQADINSDGAVTVETQKGDRLVIDTEGDALLKHRTGTLLKFGKSGSSVELASSQGTKLSFDGPNVTVESGAQVTLNCPRLVLNGTTSIELGKGAIHPLIKGDVFMSWLGAFVAWAGIHNHTPGSPPVAPPPPPPIASFLSLISKTK